MVRPTIPPCFHKVLPQRILYCFINEGKTREEVQGIRTAVRIIRGDPDGPRDSVISTRLPSALRLRLEESSSQAVSSVAKNNPRHLRTVHSGLRPAIKPTIAPATTHAGIMTSRGGNKNAAIALMSSSTIPTHSPTHAPTVIAIPDIFMI